MTQIPNIKAFAVMLAAAASLSITIAASRVDECACAIDALPRECDAVHTVAGHEPSLLPSGKNFRLVWHDEFDGDRLDESKWSYRTNFWGRRAHWFAAPEDNAVEVKDGLCRLKLVKKPNGQFVSPQLQTGELMWDIPRPKLNAKGFFSIWPLPKREKPKFMHRYGYYECRCRLQQMPGWWSAFWMQTPMQGCSLDPRRAGIEHDIMESFEPGKIIPHNFHMNGYGADYRHFGIPSVKNDSDGTLAVDKSRFHVFGLLWEPDGYSVYIDGRRRGQKVGVANGAAVSETEEFVLVSTEAKWYRNDNMTGKGVPELEATAAAGDDFAIDYVRVYDCVTDADAVTGALSIKSDYPGGNVKLIGIDERNGVLSVAPDLRDTEGKWFHWDFTVCGAAGRRMRFQFPDDNYEYLSSIGPAISKDCGATWSWLRPDGTRHELKNAFEYNFGASENETRFAVSIPYLQKDWDEFVNGLRGRCGVRQGILCKSQSGKRDTEVLRIPCAGEAQWLFVFTARHHACETSASPVMEGVIEGVLSDTPEGRWLRENAECVFVPFMDKDGVENGDQGKNRRPHDHNRDYLKERYASVKALKKLVLDESAGKRLVFVDLHSPHVRSLPSCPEQDQVFTFGCRDMELNERWNEFRKNWIATQKGGALAYDGKYDIFAGEGYSAKIEKQWAAGFMSSDAWARTLPNCYLATCCEFGYSLCGGVFSFPRARELGRSLLNATVRTAW